MSYRRLSITRSIHPDFAPPRPPPPPIHGAREFSTSSLISSCLGCKETSKRCLSIGLRGYAVAFNDPRHFLRAGKLRGYCAMPYDAVNDFNLNLIVVLVAVLPGHDFFVPAHQLKYAFSVGPSYFRLDGGNFYRLLIFARLLPGRAFERHAIDLR